MSYMQSMMSTGTVRSSIDSSASFLTGWFQGAALERLPQTHDTGRSEPRDRTESGSGHPALGSRSALSIKDDKARKSQLTCVR